MIEYLYFVKWLDESGLAEEVFEIFDEAKSFAMGILSQQPEIHQTEVIRNDFGECIDSNEIGKVWSWEDLMSDIPEEDEVSDEFNIFTRGDFAKYADGYDPENDPEFDDRDITFETDCVACEHPLDEEYYGAPRELASYVNDVISHLFFDLGKNFIDYEDFTGEVLDVLERWYSDELGLEEYDGKRYENWCDAVFCEVARQLTDNRKFSKVRHLYINESLTESAEPLATNQKGDYIVVANSGRGYTVFNKHDVAIGGFDGEDDDEAIKRFNVGDIHESCRKPIPEGKSIKDLVEEMEENEDMVECKWCEELYEKAECRYEVNMGWLCPYCVEAIKSRGEELTFRECSDLNEDFVSSFDPDDTIELDYKDLYVTIVTKVYPATYWEPEDYEEKEYKINFTYEVNADEVATLIWDLYLEEEDVTDIEGGFETLEADESAWYAFLDTHFDILFKKYYDKILKYYEDDAIEAAEAKEQEAFDNYEPDYDEDEYYFATHED